MRRFYVEVSDRAFDALAELALQQRRDVRDQAAVLLERSAAYRSARFTDIPRRRESATLTLASQGSGGHMSGPSKPTLPLAEAGLTA